MLIQQQSLKDIFNDYIDSSKINITPVTRIYLLNLLEKPKLHTSSKEKELSFIELLLNETTNIFERLSNLKTTGDNCLLYSGLYPEYISKRTGNIEYYFSIGQSAYSELYYNYRELKNRTKSYLYEELYKNFDNLIGVLDYVKRKLISNRKIKIYSKFNITGV
jgi:hypothetical protein